MTIAIPDNILAPAGITDAEARLELALRFFDLGRLELWPAAQLAGMPRLQFELELEKRNIPVYRPTLQDLKDDVRALGLGGN